VEAGRTSAYHMWHNALVRSNEVAKTSGKQASANELKLSAQRSPESVSQPRVVLYSFAACPRRREGLAKATTSAEKP
jgi:hypothetical protein